jgi:hypothetical protein
VTIYWLFIAAAAALALWGACAYFDLVPDRLQPEEDSAVFFFAQLAAALAGVFAPESSPYGTGALLLWALLFTAYCFVANA